MTMPTRLAGCGCCEPAMTEQLELDDMQGLLVSGYRTLPVAAYLLLRIDDVPAAREGLAAWAGAVTSARRPPTGTALHIAFTAAGIAALSPARRLPAGFSEPFVDGMVTPYRSRLLGDVDDDDPCGWLWGGPRNGTISAILLLYAVDAGTLSGAVAKATRHATGHGMAVVRELTTLPLSGREAFGFRDGLSQPTMAGLPWAKAGSEVVRAGEFVLGYPNEYGLLTERPLLPPSLDPGRVLAPDAAGSGYADLGRNGSYVALRQLRQDVPAFREFVDRATRAADGTPDDRARDRLAAKLVGRWPDGAPVTVSPDRDDAGLADDDFSYHHQDPDGMRCPIGAHIRRANPRDSLEPGPGTESSRELNRRHRLLRRGRNYAADGERGLLFGCLNGNLVRQYEFVQHSWINDPSFNGLVDSVDPLVGPRDGAGTTFTEPALPVRRRHQGLPGFVQVRGGGYFFLPGIRALRYLATLPNRSA
jgi:Dyp-type peroxidase family